MKGAKPEFLKSRKRDKIEEIPKERSSKTNAWNAPSFPKPSTNITADSIEIADICIEGNHITKNWVILRELQLKEGQRFHIREVDSLLRMEQSKIQNTNLFITSEIHCDYSPDRKVTLQVKVQERWYSLPMVSLDIGDRNFNEWWTERNRDLSRLIYGFSFKNKNFRGRSEQLVLSFKGGFKQAMRIGYSIPYINRAKTIGLGIDVNYQTRHNVAYQSTDHKLAYVNADHAIGNERQALAYLTHRRGFYSVHKLSIGYNQIAVNDTVLLYNAHYFWGGKAQMRYFEFSYNYRHDRRNVAAYPLKGHFFQADAIHRQGSNGYATALRVNYARFIPLSKKLFISTDWLAKTVFSPAIPYIFSEGLGYGKNLVRGYDLRVIDGQTALLCRNEIKWKLFSKTISLSRFIKAKQLNKWPLAVYPKAFLDAGQVWNQRFAAERAFLANRLLLGWGAGVDIVTSYNLAFRIEASRSAHGDKGIFLYWKVGF